jgi:hypothetical protein
VLNRLFQADNLGLRLFHQQPGLKHVGLGALSALELDGIEFQHVLIRGQSPLGVLELGIELAQVEVGTRDIGNQGGSHDLLPMLTGHQVCPGRFAGPSVFSPEIDDVRSLDEKGIEGWRARIKNRLHILNAATPTDRRQLICTGYANDGFRLHHTSRGNADIVVVGECFADEVCQNLVLEHRPEFHLTESLARRLGSRIRRQSPILVWRGHRGPVVVRPHAAATKRQQQHGCGQ